MSPEDYDPTNRLEKGDRLFFLDWDGYKDKQGHIRLRTTSVTDYVKEFPDVLSEKEFDKLPERRPWDHAIELTPGFRPVDARYIR